MKRKLAYFLTISLLTVGTFACSKSTPSSKSTEKTSQPTSTSEEKSTSDFKIEKDKYIFAQIDVPYADYYYGEIMNISPEEKIDALKIDINSEDMAKKDKFRDPGEYEAVTSVTPKKSSMFKNSYHQPKGEGSQILGVTNVNIAIPKSLYDMTKTELEKNTNSEHPLLKLVSSIKETTTSAPNEYKIINSDGTLSKTIGKYTVLSDKKSSITTNSRYGNYEIHIDELELDIDKVQGALLETEDGKKYGLLHLENIWKNPAELAFAVQEFEEGHGNSPGFNRYDDIQGKKIVKVIYLLKDENDIEVTTDLLCKNFPPADYSISTEKEIAYSKNGTKIEYKINSGDTKYTFQKIMKGKVNIKSEIKDENNTLTLPDNVYPGKYRLLFENDILSELMQDVTISSNLKKEDFIFKNDKLSIKENSENIQVSNYLDSLTLTTVNETKLKGKNGRIIFNEDGSINLDAKNKETAIFEKSGEYKVKIQADGYPDIEFIINK